MRPALRLPLLLALFAAWPAFALNPGLGPPPDTLDRDTPSAAVHGFLSAAHEGRYEEAAHYLYLDFLRRDQQAIEGPRLARRLRFVLDRKVWIDFTKISKDAAGDPAHAWWDQIGAIPLGNTNQPIRVMRVDGGDGEWVWVFGSETVKAIDRLYDAYGPPLGDELPDFFFRHSFLYLELWQW
ncbi:MAG TPA: mechanosensitive ion channel family protein, partial [Myxococcaceae bacterium]|nr:mechanosensitive ion channel family protein [Myxococcaceae bacterium]